MILPWLILIPFIGGLLCWQTERFGPTLPRWLALEYAEKMAVVPVKLGSKGIAKQIYLGAREAELHTDYLQAFIALARAPGLALPAAASAQDDS